MLERDRRTHVGLEDLREGGAVGDVEEAKRADRHMQVDLVYPIAEDPITSAAVQDLAERFDHGNVQALYSLRAREVCALVDILHHHEPDEFLIGILVVKGEPDERADRRLRVKVRQVEGGFDLSNPTIGLLQYCDEKAFLVGKIIIDHPLARGGPSCDFVYAGAAVTFVGELVHCDVDDVLARRLRIVPPPT